jgi:hypothetical protein
VVEDARRAFVGDVQRERAAASVKLGLALALALAGCSSAPPCPTTLTKGPWVERVDDTHATVIWESSTNGCVEVTTRPEVAGTPGRVDERAAERVDRGAAMETHVVADWGPMFGLKQPDLAGTYYRNEVALSGLSPATCYQTRVRGSGQTPTTSGIQTGRFCTARPAGATFSFLAIGDTNPILGHTLPVLNHVLPRSPDFTLHLGDMQYYSSAAETYAYWFAAMAPLLRSGGLFPAIGNHENEDEPALLGAEFDDYYLRLFSPPSVDGQPLWYQWENGGVAFFSLDTEEALDAASPQVTWLASALEQAKARPGWRFSIVYFHRPLYTLGDATPLLDARQVLEPLFLQHGVPLVLQAHMHGYERFETPSGLTYVTCAGGGGIIGNPSMNVATYPADAPLRKVVSDHFHACLYNVAPGHLTSTVIDEAGATIDSFDKAVP